MPRLTNLSRTVTVDDVYRGGIESLERNLSGRQEFVDFRIPAGTEMFMKLDGTVITHNPASTYHFGGPRLIVEERRRKIITYTETGEIRVSGTFDQFLDEDGIIRTGQSVDPVAIVTRTESFVAE